MTPLESSVWVMAKCPVHGTRWACHWDGLEAKLFRQGVLVGVHSELSEALRQRDRLYEAEMTDSAVAKARGGALETTEVDGLSEAASALATVESRKSEHGRAKD